MNNLDEKHELFYDKSTTLNQYAKTIESQVVGVEKKGGKNRMAMAIYFEALYRYLGSKFNEFIDKNNGELLECDLDILLEKSDFLINWFNQSESDYKDFWAGKCKLKPDKLQFREEGKEQLTFLNLNEIKDMTIGQLTP